MSETDNNSELPERPKTPFTPLPGAQSTPPTPYDGAAGQTPANLQRARTITLALPRVDPYLTYAFLAINIAAFLATQALGLRPNGVPVLWDLGWKQNARIVDGEYWRLVTPIFLHGNIAHLFFNSYALYILGPSTERVLGYVRFFFIYILSGIAGVIASLVFSINPSLGASGAIFGLIGAQVAYFYNNRDLFDGIGNHRIQSLLQFAAINLLFGFLPGTNIDNWAHIGGLIGGAALSWALGPIFILKPRMDGALRVDDSAPLEQRWWAILFGTAMLVMLTFFIIKYELVPVATAPSEGELAFLNLFR